MGYGKLAPNPHTANITFGRDCAKARSPIAPHYTIYERRKVHAWQPRSFYSELAEHLPSVALLAPVLYRDYSSEIVPEGTHMRYFVKRHYFIDEREVRAVIVDPPANAEGTEDLERTNLDAGRALPVNLNTLLKAIVCRTLRPSR